MPTDLETPGAVSIEPPSEKMTAPVLPLIISILTCRLGRDIRRDAVGDPGPEKHRRRGPNLRFGWSAQGIDRRLESLDSRLDVAGLACEARHGGEDLLEEGWKSPLLRLPGQHRAGTEDENRNADDGPQNAFGV